MNFSKLAMSSLMLALPFVYASADGTPAKVEDNPATIMRGSRSIDEGAPNPDRIAHKPLALPADIADPNNPTELAEGWTDITPEYFDFHKLDAEYLDEMVCTTPTNNAGGFTGSNTAGIGWVADRVKESEGAELSKGFIFLSGYMLHRDGDRVASQEPPKTADGKNNPLYHQNETTLPRQSFKKGLKVHDFGDEVGRVLMFNGLWSTLNTAAENLPSSYFTDNLNNDNTKADFIHFRSEQKASSLLFLPVNTDVYHDVINKGMADGQTDSDKSYIIRVVVEYNMYQNVTTDAKGQKVYPALTNNAIGDLTGIVTCYGYCIRTDTDYSGNTPQEKDPIAVKVGDGPYYKANPDDPDDATTYWTATKWITYETNLLISPRLFAGTSARMTDAIPCVRLQLPSHNINNMAYMIRNVRMYMHEVELENGQLPATYVGQIDGVVRGETTSYLLRPNQIEVAKKKLYVGEETTLQAEVFPTWATREVRWVLVDNQGNQYQDFDPADSTLPAEIRDYVAEFDGSTGKIKMKKNGSVMVQAISLAEGENAETEQVKKVMSSVTELPVFDVIYGIDIDHGHHYAIDGADAKSIELSGSESTRVEYILKTLQDVTDPKFDPDTELSFSAETSDAVYVTFLDHQGTPIHGKNHAGEMFGGRGYFDIAIDADAGKSSAMLKVKVVDGRETWDLYKGKLDNRDGETLLLHYAKPTMVAVGDDIAQSAGAYSTLYDDNTRICISRNGQATGEFEYTVTADVRNDVGNGDEAKQLYNWALDKAYTTDADNTGAQENDIVRVVAGENGLTIIPKADGVTFIHFTTIHAGEHKWTLVPDASAPASLRKAMPIGAPTDEHNYADGETIYEPYGPNWAKTFSGSQEFAGEEPENATTPFLIEINPNGLSDFFEIPALIEADPTYYNLQGIRLEGEPGPGTYIKLTGNSASKIRKQ